MKYIFIVYTLLLISLVSCSSSRNKTVTSIQPSENSNFDSQFNLAFGSCNKHNEPNNLWDDILQTKPDVWVWGGDIVYADTYNMKKLARLYRKQNEVAGYKELRTEVPVIGTWDDHDYGVNDGGAGYSMKKESQAAFLTFLGIGHNDLRRKQEGVYSSHLYERPEGNIKIIVLDTRYFRTALKKSNEPGKRYEGDTDNKATILGDDQWQWLANELNESTADFNIIVSSIQVLSAEHGFETWGNFPTESKKLENLIRQSAAKGVIILSGDRHLSEFSRKTVKGLDYPLIDFTSSGLTHAYHAYKGEPNQYRVGEVTATESFGLLRFNFETQEVQMQIRGNDHRIYNTLIQTY